MPPEWQDDGDGAGDGDKVHEMSHHSGFVGVLEQAVNLVLSPSHSSTVNFSGGHLGFSDNGSSIIGTPSHDAAYYHHQRADFTCALVAQIAILQEYTGRDYEECKAAVEASQFHLIDTQGTTPENVGAWLALHGIDCHMNPQADFGQILRELSEGHKVIVGVNGEELWRHNATTDSFAHLSVDHAIWLTGVDFADPSHPKVIINDSGDPNGAARVYELNDFLQAAQPSGSTGLFYVATNEPPPDLSDRVPDFDSHLGLVPALSQFIDQHALELGGIALAASTTSLLNSKPPVSVGPVVSRPASARPTKAESPTAPTEFHELPPDRRDQLLSKL